MASNIFQKGLTLLLRRQTNILSAAFIIMGTVVFSQLLGLIRSRLLVGIFGASNTLGIYLASTRLPEFLFQLVIAGALSTAFIPVFSEFIERGQEEKAHRMASSLLVISLVIFSLLSLVLFLFAPFFLGIMNLGVGFSRTDMALMANLMRIIIVGQLFFIVGTFFTALLQSYNHFFIPGIASALYNMGIIIGILILHSFVGIYAAAYGVVLGALTFLLVQLPMVRRMGFRFRPSLLLSTPGVLTVYRLMWPRTLALGIVQLSSIAIVALVSFLPAPGRNFVIFDYAQTLAFAPIVLFGQTIAQAAFPVLARERERLSEFKTTFATSFTQMLYLVLPVSVLFLVLRIPLVRLVYGAAQFDWEATVLTGRTLAFFSLSIFAQALTALVARGFYALHDTKTPLVVSSIASGIMLGLGGFFVISYRQGVESLAIAYSLSTIVNFLISVVILDRKVGGFPKGALFSSVAKIFLATFFTGFALYIPIKLLDQLVFDTTRTVNLIILTGISSFAGLSLYLFLTWLFNVKEATTFLLIFKKIGNWREVLKKSEEVIDGTRFNP